MTAPFLKELYHDQTNAKPARSRFDFPYETLDSKKFHEAAERALDHYLNPLLPRKPLLKPNARYLIAPGIDSEELLADACETLTSAKTMANDFAGLVDGPQRHVLLGIAQRIMLGELAVNRVLDNLELKTEAAV